MRFAAVAVACTFLLGLMPVAAGPPGHISATFSFKATSDFDFKNGVGVADPNDEDNPCTLLLLGQRAIQPISQTWSLDLAIATNLNGPAVGLSNQAPPLTPVPAGWLSGSAGIPLAPCPVPGSSSSNLWLIWSGANWRSAWDISSTQLFLCTQTAPVLGCLPTSMQAPRMPRTAWLPPPAPPTRQPPSRTTTPTPKARTPTASPGTPLR